MIISKRKNLRNKLGVLQILLITFLFLINVSTVFALSRTEAENYSKKISGADKYSIFASSEKIRILGFLRSDSSSESFFGSNRNFSNVIQVKAGSDFAALITSNNVLKLFGNYKKFISTDTLTNVKQVALGQEHLAVLNLDGTLKVYGNVDLNKRIYGIHRYATAASVSREKFVSSKYVVIVSGESYADALYAVPLARALRAPILLTRKTGLPAETISELKRLSPTMVYIIGGYSIIDSTIENQIANELKSAPPTRKRIAGSNRYETSVLVARELARVLKKSTFHKVYLTVGTDFADALSVSPLAASEGVPVLLVNKYGMPSSVSKFLSEFKVGSTIVIGGTDIIPDAVIKSAPKPTRIYGANKYIRSTNIANYAINNLYFDPSRIYIATGENFPDALVAGVLASIDRNVLLLVPRVLPLQLATEKFLTSRKDSIYRVVVVGPESVVSQQVVSRICMLTNNNWSSKVPQKIQGKVVSIASGKSHLIALTSDGKVYAWGNNKYEQCNVPSGLQGSCVQIASGGYHSLALRSDGKVYAWGANFAKQRDLTGLNLTNVVMLDGGLSHSVALKADGTVVVFGDTYVNHTYPFEVIEGKNRRVPGVIQGKVIGIACGDNHTLALTSDGYVYGWGDNQYGQSFGPWDADMKNCNHLDSLDTTFTYEFNAPVSIVPDLITFLRHDGQSVPITVKTSGKNLFIKPGAPLNYDYYYTIVFKNGSLKPLEYSLDEMPEFEASYSSWRLFTINGVVYNRTYNWPVTPLIEFFSNVVESSYHLYRDGNLVDWNNGQPVKDKGNYRLEVSARTSSGNESSVTLNFRIDY